MDDKQTRIRLDDDELGRLAAAMAPRLLADPSLHPLEAVRAAQDCLQPHRRRELKAWSLVEGRLQPKLDEAMTRLCTSPSDTADEPRTLSGSEETTAHDPADAADGEHADTSVPPAVAAQRDWDEARPSGPSIEGGDERRPSLRNAVVGEAGAETSGQNIGLSDDVAGLLSASGNAVAGVSLPSGGGVTAMATGDAPGGAEPATFTAVSARHDEQVRPGPPATVDPLMIEAALVAALQSPAVEAALVELFGRTMSKALAQASAGESRSVPTQAARPLTAQRVLLAGFPEAQQKTLADALGGRFDVRTWKPSNGPQLFETLVRMCATVVFPEEADDDAEADLKDRDVRVIRHAGNASRLVEGIEELG